MIMIETEKVVSNRGTKARKIIALSALRYEELPWNYTHGGDCVYAVPGPKQLYCSSGSSLEVGGEYSEEEWVRIFAFVQRCGMRLSAIKAARKKLQAEWNGRETFVI